MRRIAINRNAHQRDARKIELERQAERGGFRSRGMPRNGQPRIQQALSVRLANDGDREIIEQLAQLDSGAVPSGPLLFGTVDLSPAAVLSLGDGTVVADPFTPTLELLQLMRIRARQLEPGRGPVRRAALAPPLRIRRTTGRRA